jgi:hypothetical protein
MMADEPICPCDGVPTPSTIANPPGRDQIAYRVGDFAAFRRALMREAAESLGPESALKFWQPSANGDLGVQMLEWWAYLADILTFYNERIANEAYLRTATLPESVRRLIRTIGYRPRPGIAAHGNVVALVGGHRAFKLPRCFSFDSKPGPGKSPQTFELDVDTQIAPENTIAARPTSHPVSATETVLYIAGSKLPVLPGTVLLLRSRSGPLVRVLKITATQVETTSAGPRTRLDFTTANALPTTTPASDLALVYSSQAAAVSTLDSSALSTNIIHLATLCRDLHAGDYVILTASNQTAPLLCKVTTITDAVWYAIHGTGPGDPPAPPNVPIPILHSLLTLDTDIPSGWSYDKTTVHFLWRDLGALLDHPVTTFSGSSSATLSAQALAFPAGSGRPVIVSDAIGTGAAGFASPSNAGKTLSLSGLPQPLTLMPPLTVHYNLLNISRGKTVVTEILGSGDATIPGQEFVLKKSPLTYLAKGDSYVNTLAVWVNGRLWKEAKSFYQQPRDAEIFVTREDEHQKTHVRFGDGENGGRLPTGINNVVATYRYGSGAEAPLSGEITVINKPYPNLKSVQNPVAVGGGADPDPPDQIRRFAPNSIMTFGRAISEDDYEVIASRAPGVTRARAIWSFDATEQRTAVKVYVGGDANAVQSVKGVIASTGDPHRHVIVAAATPITIILGLPVRIDGRVGVDDVKAALRKAMLDDDHGVFGRRRLGIGQVVFDSEIAAACHACEGVLSLRHVVFIADGPWGSAFDFSPRHVPAEGAFYRLDAEHLFICPEVVDHVR